MKFSLLLALFCCSASLGQPILSALKNFFSGFKYVPPQTGILASQSTTSPSYVGDERKGTVVFSTSGWLHPAGSTFFYLIGQEAVTFSEANNWCEKEGGYLAEIYDKKQMDVVKDLLQRDSKSNFWIGLEQPRDRWSTSRRNVDYTNWAHSEPNGYSHEKCTILWTKKNFAWADWNCSYKKDHHTSFKALCQKKHFEEEIEDKIVSTLDISEFRSDSQCTVNSVSLRGEDWLERIDQVSASELCHKQCLDTPRCQFWTWRSDSNICYLRTTDGPVTTDKLAVSGTTLASRGCHRSLEAKQSRAEHCTCKTVSHLVTDGYIDPRALPFDAEGSGNGDIDKNAHLGRLIIQSACPNGQTLSCTYDEEKEDKETSYNANEVEIIEAKGPVFKSNITDCLVNDVRLSVGGLISKVFNVQSSATCHAHCLATPGCTYWTWRGDTQDKKCFLKPSEGRTVRRHGAASGTVLRSLGCDHKIIHHNPQVAETREEVGCYCQREYNQDLVSSGLIDPRTVPIEIKDSPQQLGRIVSFGVKEKKCGLGYRRVCGGNQNRANGPKLFASGLPELDKLGLVRERTIPKRELPKEDDLSAVSFPENK